MEKRFGVKDFLLFAVLLMVLISVWLMMFQVDRQWEFISKVEKQIEEQSKDLAELRRQIRVGGTLDNSAQSVDSGTDASWQGFSRLAEVRERKDYARGDWIVEAFSVASPTMTPYIACLLYTSPSPRDQRGSRMPSSA